MTAMLEQIRSVIDGLANEQGLFLATEDIEDILIEMLSTALDTSLSKKAFRVEAIRGSSTIAWWSEDEGWVEKMSAATRFTYEERKEAKGLIVFADDPDIEIVWTLA